MTALEYGLCLGTNLGDRLAHLQEATDAIRTMDGVALVARSRVYETEPVDVQDEHRNRFFLNAVLIVSALPDALRFARRLHGVEDAAGRVRTNDRNAPRPIDIDIIYCGQTRIESHELRVPHPHWATRRFVAQPLSDVRPELVLPGQTRTVREVLLSLPRDPKVVLFSRDW